MSFIWYNLKKTFRLQNSSVSLMLVIINMSLFLNQKQAQLTEKIEMSNSNIYKLIKTDKEKNYR